MANTTITITPVEDPALRDDGYTHEYFVRNDDTGYGVRAGITKGMTFTKLAQLWRGERLSS